MPGSGKQPPEIQEQIKELLEAGFDPTTIHRRLKVGRSSIYRMKRCLQQHGTNYMPVELNKKNGRPKVLNADQELEVREWLRDTKNRKRYLDDLVWLIHDRFSIVCSTTTMSKMKRKWLRVIDYEENGIPIDELTRAQLLETHPDLPILSDPNAFQGPETQQLQGPEQLQGGHPPFAEEPRHHLDHQHALQMHHHQHIPPEVPQMSSLQVHHQALSQAQQMDPVSVMDPAIDSQLQQELHSHIAMGPEAHGDHVAV